MSVSKILVIGAIVAILSAPLSASSDEGLMAVELSDAANMELNDNLLGGFDQMSLPVALGGAVFSDITNSEPYHYIGSMLIIAAGSGNAYLSASGGEPQPADIAYKSEEDEGIGIMLNHSAPGWLSPGGNDTVKDMNVGNKSLLVAACVSCHS